MRFHFILLIAIVAIVNAASLDDINLSNYPIVTAVSAHETKWSKFLKPLRKLIDKIFHRKVSDAQRLEAAAEYPWSLINTPSYANWTSDGWKAHLHANLYKIDVELPQKKIDHLLEKILLRATLKKPKFWDKNSEWIGPEEADKGRDFVRNIATYSLDNAIINAKISEMNCTLQLPAMTNSEGSVDAWLTLNPRDCDIYPPSDVVQVNSMTMVPANVQGPPDTSNHRFKKADTFLVPANGLTIVSDIDDVLRVAEVWNPKQAILDLVTRPFQPWLDMPDIYQR